MDCANFESGSTYIENKKYTCIRNSGFALIFIIQTHRHQDGLIVTHFPKPKHAVDIVRLLLDHGSCLVILGKQVEQNKVSGTVSMKTLLSRENPSGTTRSIHIAVCFTEASLRWTGTFKTLRNIYGIGSSTMGQPFSSCRLPIYAPSHI